MRFVAGLGNPGRKYEETRHNVGFLVLDELGRRWGCEIGKPQFGALVGQASVHNESTVFIKPQQFMNRSGQPVRSIVSYFKESTESLIVVHDDVDLAFGMIRVKQGGGHGGHNGLRDLDRHMESRDYVRVRVGVGRPPENWNTADYVLGRWAPEERDVLGAHVDKAADAVEHILTHGVKDTQNHFNEKGRQHSDTDAPTEQGASPSPIHQVSNSPSRTGLRG